MKKAITAGQEVIALFTGSTHIRLKFVPDMNFKMPVIVGILQFIT